MTGRILSALALALLAACPAFGQVRQQAHGVHEIRLGMSLEKFRALDRFVELEEDGKRLFCSDEPPSRNVDHVRPAWELEKAGAIACGILPLGEEFDPEDGATEFFGELVKASFIFFQPTGYREPRLTQMILVMSNERFERVLEIFRRTYGQSTRAEVHGGLMISGAAVSNVTYTWENSISSIHLDMYSINIDRARATLIHRDWWDELLRRAREIRFGE